MRGRYLKRMLVLRHDGSFTQRFTLTWLILLRDCHVKLYISVLIAYF